MTFFRGLQLLHEKYLIAKIFIISFSVMTKTLTLFLLGEGGGGVYWTPNTFFLKILFEDLNKKNETPMQIPCFVSSFQACMIGF